MADLPPPTFADLEQSAINAPISAYHASPVTPECKRAISAKAKVPIIILDTFMSAESGYPGHIRSNSDGSWDVGQVQINSVHWHEFYTRFHITPIQLRFDGCLNLLASAYRIRWHLDRAGKEKINDWDDLLQVLANYHSGTPHVNQTYQAHWLEHFKKQLSNQ